MGNNYGIEENKASVEGNIGLLQAAIGFSKVHAIAFISVSCTFFFFWVQKRNFRIAF